jgi:hypothetical protein
VLKERNFKQAKVNLVENHLQPVFTLIYSGQSQDVTGMSTTASSWHYSPSASGIADFSPLLKKYTYQLSFTGD